MPSVKWEDLKRNPVYFVRRWLQLGLAPEQIKFLREINERTGRFGLVWDSSERLTVTVLGAALWRAFCCDTPSVIVVASEESAQRWIDVLTVCLTLTDQSVQDFVTTVTDNSPILMTAAGTPILYPLNLKDSPVPQSFANFDVYFGDFDNTPTKIIDLVCARTEPEHLLILPTTQ